MAAALREATSALQEPANKQLLTDLRAECEFQPSEQSCIQGRVVPTPKALESFHCACALHASCCR